METVTTIFTPELKTEDSSVHYTDLAQVFGENTRGKPKLCIISTLQNTFDVTTNKPD